MKVKVSGSVVSLWTVARQAPLSLGLSRQESWSGCHFPPHGIFPTQGSNPGLPHSRQILYCLHHQGILLPFKKYTFFYTF